MSLYENNQATGDLTLVGGSVPYNSVVAPIEVTSTASQAYAQNDQFVYNGLLYTASSAIAKDATIIPGTNCTLSDDVVHQLASLKSSLTPQAVTGITTSGTATTSANYSAYRTGNVVQIGGYFNGTWSGGGTVLKNLPAPKDSDNKVRFTARNGSNSSAVDVYFTGNDLCVSPSCTSLNFNITYIAQ